MMDYPPNVPDAARAAVERALADAEHEFIVAAAGAGPRRVAMVPGDITWPGMWDQSDRAAVAYVVNVFAVIVEALCAAARKSRWRAEQLRETSATLLSRLTESTYREKHSKGVGGFGPITLDAFTTIVHRELRTLACWSTLQDTIRALSAQAVQQAASAKTPPTPKTVVTGSTAEPIAGRAEWLKAQMRARGNLSANRIAVLAGLSHHTVQKVLAGRAVRDDVLDKLAQALTAAMPSHPITITDIPSAL